EGSENAHAPDAARTNIPLFVFVTTICAIAVSARGSWVWYAEELTGQCDIGGPVGIGEEAVVANAVEPVRQHMDQEAADELVGVERHELGGGGRLGPGILPIEKHGVGVQGD